MIAFRIEQWRAWAPGLETPDAWQAWAQAPVVVPDRQEQPECLALPPMQRRRLSRLARMTMEVASPLCGDNEQLPFVFASRHGETTRTFALLADVTDGQPLSPTQFGLAVHNGIAGQWSILRGQRGESVAIAGEADTFEHALLEAAALLAAGASSVLAVIAEEMPPPAYTGWIDDVPFSYAVALRLGRADSAEPRSNDHGWTLRLERHDGDVARCAWPHALDFLRALQRGEQTLQHTWKTRRWTWQRAR
ncbi:MAG: beta-ketoacyl synthase chain length factor [Rhodanobacter sp.]